MGKMSPQTHRRWTKDCFPPISRPIKGVARQGILAGRYGLGMARECQGQLSAACQFVERQNALFPLDTGQVAHGPIGCEFQKHEGELAGSIALGRAFEISEFVRLWPHYEILCGGEARVRSYSNPALFTSASPHSFSVPGFCFMHLSSFCRACVLHCVTSPNRRRCSLRLITLLA